MSETRKQLASTTRNKPATTKGCAANTCRVMAAQVLREIRSAPPEKRFAMVRRARVWLALANDSDKQRRRQQGR